MRTLRTRADEGQFHDKAFRLQRGKYARACSAHTRGELTGFSNVGHAPQRSRSALVYELPKTRCSCCTHTCPAARAAYLWPAR